MAEQHNFQFRRANINDMQIVREMIQELADFEKMSTGPQLTETDLIRDSGLNGDKEYCHIYVLDLKQTDSQTTTTVGYAICFFAYSTWQGRTYFLEDLYVRPPYRDMGAGARMFREIAAQAHEYNCQRLDFHVLAWNPARRFYDHMGATDLTTSEDWHFYRLNAQRIAQITNQLKQLTK